MEFASRRLIEWLNDPQDLLDGVLIKVVEDGIDAFAIESTVDHLLLSPRIRDLFDADGDFHVADVTRQSLIALFEDMVEMW
jgi:hypothetical protein